MAEIFWELFLFYITFFPAKFQFCITDETNEVRFICGLRNPVLPIMDTTLAR